MPLIREFNASDTDDVVALSLRAWAPVHISIREALGPEINDALQPDWRATQQADVEGVLEAAASKVWVADIDGVVAGFVAVRIHDDRRIGEIDMLAVDPPHQGLGIGTALTRAALDWIRASGVHVAMVGTGADPGHAPGATHLREGGDEARAHGPLLHEALMPNFLIRSRTIGNWRHRRTLAFASEPAPEQAFCIGMDLRSWPSDFLEKKAGIGCPQCTMGRVDETNHGVRYYAGPAADGYLQRQGPTAGYSVVIFRGRHVGEPQAMTPEEHATFWSEVSTVANAITTIYEPIHLNFQILGNQDPHVHVHIVPRFDPDPAPSLPLPAAAWENGRVLSSEELGRQVHRLKAALGQ